MIKVTQFLNYPSIFGKTAVTISAVFCIAGTNNCNAEPGKEISELTGTWEGQYKWEEDDWKSLTTCLEQAGNKIYGEYGSTGTLSGNLTGDVLQYTYSSDDCTDKGYFNVSEDSSQLTGEYQCGDEKGLWKLVRIDKAHCITNQYDALYESNSTQENITALENIVRSTKQEYEISQIHLLQKPDEDIDKYNDMSEKLIKGYEDNLKAFNSGVSNVLKDPPPENIEKNIQIIEALRDEMKLLGQDIEKISNQFSSHSSDLELYRIKHHSDVRNQFFDNINAIIKQSEQEQEDITRSMAR